MIIRYIWRKCDAFGGKQPDDLVDAFWVEATQDEAETVVFPKLLPTEIAESRKLAVRYHKLAQEKDLLARSFCFLVAWDLRSIRPLPMDYPTATMWNTYSPFEKMPEAYVRTLEEIKYLKLPPKYDD